MKALLEVRNLSIGIQTRTLLSAVQDISFDVRAGEILGIVGESGSGKSLTALSIAGLLDENKIAGGQITYNRKNLLTLTETELQRIRGKEISMIFQEPFSSLNPLMPIGEQIAETLELHGETGKAAIRGEVIELMKKMGLDDAENLYKTYPHRISGGMCQRVMIALAIICRPRLLIADEPTTALDFATQSQILSLMKTINNEMGTSILFISHDLSLVKNFCDTVLVMYCGRILEEGSAAEVFSRPSHEYTRGLLASIPDSKTAELTAIPGKVPSLEEGRPAGCPFHPRCAKAAHECRREFPPARFLSDTHVSRCVAGATSER